MSLFIIWFSVARVHIGTPLCSLCYLQHIKQCLALTVKHDQGNCEEGSKQAPLLGDRHACDRVKLF